MNILPVKGIFFTMLKLTPNLFAFHSSDSHPPFKNSLKYMCDVIVSSIECSYNFGTIKCMYY